MIRLLGITYSDDLLLGVWVRHAAVYRLGRVEHRAEDLVGVLDGQDPVRGPRHPYPHPRVPRLSGVVTYLKKFSVVFSKKYAVKC